MRKLYYRDFKKIQGGSNAIDYLVFILSVSVALCLIISFGLFYYYHYQSVTLLLLPIVVSLFFVVLYCAYSILPIQLRSYLYYITKSKKINEFFNNLKTEVFFIENSNIPNLSLIDKLQVYLNVKNSNYTALYAIWAVFLVNNIKDNQDVKKN